MTLQRKGNTVMWFQKKAPAVAIQASTQDQIQADHTDNTPKVHFFTKFIFWLSLVSFLANSIQHVAWVYHVYEGNTPQPINLWLVQFDLKWLIPYGTAVGIDVLTSWLAFIQTLGKSKSEGRITWGFIFALCGLSWYCNYLYSMMNDPVHQSDMWNISILFGLTTTGYITPIIVSAVPVFVIAYTFMLSKMGTSALTASDLEKQITELQTMNAKKQELTGLKRQAFVSNITGLVGTTKAVLQATQTQIEAPAQPKQPEEETGVPADQETGPIVTWTKDNTVASVQFPGSQPVYYDHGNRVQSPVDMILNAPTTHWTTDPLQEQTTDSDLPVTPSTIVKEKNTGELETPSVVSEQPTETSLKIAPRIRKNRITQAAQVEKQTV